MESADRSGSDGASAAERALEDRFGRAFHYIRNLTGEVEPGGGGGPSEPPFADLQPGDAERYVVEGELASGGSARILHVFDRTLQRLVAMKVLRSDRPAAEALERFLEEARATGQLEHPNIPPVYDLGLHPQYGPYFTLRLVRGRTLREIIRDLAIRRLETMRRYTLTRMVQILQQVAMGVHYAHMRGVIHRDLKPENIMVGDFGEVIILDWGVAKISVRRPDSTEYEAPIVVGEDGGPLEEAAGRVAGTLSYMSPEQARGWTEEIDERTDVFGLGAVLYEILTYHPPYEGTNFDEVYAKACAGDIVPPSRRAPRNPVPPSLEAICLKALAASKDDRYADAMAFHEELQVYLDGTLDAERRRREAGHLTLDGRQKAREYFRLAEEEERLRNEGEAILSGLPPYAPVEEKERAWALFERADEVGERRIRKFNEATAALHSALHIYEDAAEAKDALAELYWHRFEEAEAAGNRVEMAIYRHLVERYGQARFTSVLEDTAHLTLATDPPQAEVEIHRVFDRGWRLEEAFELRGETPLKVSIRAGHYVAYLRKEGFARLRAPISLERGEKQLARFSLYREGAVPEGFIVVPQGEFTIGGDPQSPGAFPLGRRYLGDFAIGRFPVTFREYCRFLDALREKGDPDLAKWIPATPREGQCVRRGEAGFEPDLDALDIDAATRERHAPDFAWELPLFGVTWFAAERYARWLSEMIGLRCRLPREVEWEKAARGPGGFLFPWGSRFDWSLAKGGLSRPERAQPEPAGTFATDVSIYGVRDLAGGVREWCADWFLEGRYRSARGGFWSCTHPAAFRTAQRSGFNPMTRSSVIGFRVVCELEPSRDGQAKG